MRELQPADPEAVGPYRLEARIGEGGMGAVYLGRDGAGRRVAVKVVRPELAGDRAFLARFHDEARNAERVASFCTAAVLDHGQDAGLDYMVTEYIDGPSLLEHVAEEGRLSAGMLHGVAVGVAAALVAIHAAGLVHRDLKPSNVLLSISGPRVIDFGIARALDEASSHTRTGQLVGTPGYIAPEQVTGRSITPAVDIFAWGCLVAFAANAENPYGRGSFEMLMGRVLHGEPELGALTEPLAGVVRAALAKDPAHRPTAQDLLLRLVGGGSEAAVNTSLGASWTPPPTAAADTPAGPAGPSPQQGQGTQGPPPAYEPTMRADQGQAPPPAYEPTMRADQGQAPPPAYEPTMRADSGQGGYAPPSTGPQEHPRTQPADVPQQYQPQQQFQQPGYTPTRLSGPPEHMATSPTLHRPKERRRSLLLPIGAAVAVLVIGGGAAAYALTANGDKDKNAKGAAAQEKPGVLPKEALLLVRVDTESGWPSSCHAKVGTFRIGADTASPLTAGPCDVLPQRSPDDKRVAFTRRVNGSSSLYVMNIDGTGAKKIVDVMAGGRATWSPDGSKLAYVAKDAGDVPQIYTVSSADGSGKTALTSDGAKKDDPSWSAANRIAFWSERSGTSQIYSLDAGDPAKPWEKLTDTKQPDVDPVWSPDGKSIAFARGKYPKGTIWTASADGGGPRKVVGGGEHDMDPSWFRNGKWICYVQGDYRTPTVRAVQPDGKYDQAIPLKEGTIAHPNC
ncbi:protein kinase domain-containing protein [Actinomadura parmotrematis]|uniref:Protein kinase n=1 Tax=Actinomadura parmotrematis TaxID=2864039 RepID=A0ABS7FYZ3_9ACTN|nr:protein kinase [Actinomadura parmotrematis]MBW8485657.1 protein kinase [Actinomadura parmotrematis]